tara:strand:+ start:784 stop:1038 length:255 start_codon:yes stop_codon:yes gene_type:complete
MGSNIELRSFSYYSESNFSRFGPAINPVIAKTTRDATPQKIAELFNSPTANVANKIEGMKLVKTSIYKAEHTKIRGLSAVLYQV